METFYIRILINFVCPLHLILTILVIDTKFSTMTTSELIRYLEILGYLLSNWTNFKLKKQSEQNQFYCTAYLFSQYCVSYSFSSVQYEDYLKVQQKMIEEVRREERLLIPEDLDYDRYNYVWVY